MAVNKDNVSQMWHDWFMTDAFAVERRMHRFFKILPHAWRKVDGVHQISRTDGTVALLANDSNAVLPHLLEEAASAHVRITSVDIREPNLEAVFLHLTGRALRY